MIFDENKVSADSDACSMLDVCADLHQSVHLGEIVSRFTKEKLCLANGGKGIGGNSGGGQQYKDKDVESVPVFSIHE